MSKSFMLKFLFFFILLANAKIITITNPLNKCSIEIDRGIITIDRSDSTDTIIKCDDENAIELCEKNNTLHIKGERKKTIHITITLPNKCNTDVNIGAGSVIIHNIETVSVNAGILTLLCSAIHKLQINCGKCNAELTNITNTIINSGSLNATIKYEKNETEKNTINISSGLFNIKIFSNYGCYFTHNNTIIEQKENAQIIGKLNGFGYIAVQKTK